MVSTNKETDAQGGYRTGVRPYREKTAELWVKHKPFGILKLWIKIIIKMKKFTPENFARVNGGQVSNGRE